MRWIARHLRSTLLMLLMAAFVVVPVADVLACAGGAPDGDSATYAVAQDELKRPPRA